MMRDRVLYFPLFVVLAFTIATFVLFLSNFLTYYPVDNYLELCGFFVTSNVFLTLGYYLGIKTKLVNLNVKEIDFGKLAFVGFFIYLILFIPILSEYTALTTNNLFEYFTNPVEAYNQMVDKVSGDRSERWQIIIIKIIISPLVILVLPIFFYSVLFEKKHKTYALVAVFLMFVLSVARGTDKELFDVLIIFFSIYLLFLAKQNELFVHHKASRKNTKTKKNSVVIILGVAVVIILGLFSFKKSERLSGLSYEYCLKDTGVCQPLGLFGDVSTFSIGVNVFNSYLTQGYYGLSRALHADFDSGFGFGHSLSLQYLAAKLFGLDFSHNVINQLSDHGWSSKGLWSSGYSWIANDVPFILVPIVIFALSFVMAYSYKQALLNDSKHSIIIYSYLFFSFIYLPANLQLAQSGDLYVGFLFWFCIYIFLMLFKSLKV